LLELWLAFSCEWLALRSGGLAGEDRGAVLFPPANEDVSVRREPGAQRRRAALEALLLPDHGPRVILVSEVDPDAVLPGHGRVADLLAALDAVPPEVTP